MNLAKNLGGWTPKNLGRTAIQLDKAGISFGRGARGVSVDH
jgi:hypothetical protein